MNLELTPGTTCVANGKVIQIDGPDSLTTMRVRDVASGTISCVAIAQIEPLPKSSAPSTAEGISAEEWKRCCELAKDLMPLNDHRTVARSQLEKLAKRHHLSVRQLQRARAAFIKDPRASVLARRPGGRPLGLNQLAPEVDQLIRHVIAKHYLRRERPPKEYVVARARSLARRLKLSPPSRSAVLTRIAREEGYETDRARMGSKAAKQRWEARTGKLEAGRPLELIQIDHTPADVLVLTDDRLEVLGRPWVTVAIDVASRCVLGMYITMAAPSSVSVSLCIEHSVLPKPENEAHPGIWPMYGKPKKILVDNGKDFRSMALERGCEQHGIDLAWRPVRTPHYGAHIERLIGTLMKIAHLLPGTTFSNIREKGDYDSAGQARLTLGEFRDWMTQKVCRFYHARRHRSLGAPPIVAWERGLQNEIGQVVPPALPARPLEFRMDFLPFVLRPVRRTGITFGASRYWHPDLSPLLRKGEVLVRYDPRDPGQVWVRRPDGVLVTAPAIAGRAVGEAGSRRALDAEAQARMDGLVDEGFEKTDQIEAQAQQQTRQARRSSRRRRVKGHSTRARAAAGAAPPNPADLTGVPAKTSPGRAAISVDEWI